MKDDFDKRWYQFLRQAEDFRSGKRKQYPDMLRERLFVDKAWESRLHGNVVNIPDQQIQDLLRQYIDNWKWSQLRLLFIVYYGINYPEAALSAAWQNPLFWKLAERHVPGFQKTNARPKQKRPRGAPPKHNLKSELELFHWIEAIKAHHAATHGNRKLRTETAIGKLPQEVLDRYTGGKPMKTTSMRTRYQEIKKRLQTAELAPLAELGKKYKNSRAK
jgi:hypothetical protein